MILKNGTSKTDNVRESFRKLNILLLVELLLHSYNAVAATSLG